jgi:hypothetical protein
LMPNCAAEQVIRADGGIACLSGCFLAFRLCASGRRRSIPALGCQDRINSMMRGAKRGIGFFSSDIVVT